jgi:hypothetical protein
MLTRLREKHKKPPYLAPLQIVIAAVHIKTGNKVEIVEQITNQYALDPRYHDLYALQTGLMMV